MHQVSAVTRRFLSEEEGVTAIEYGLIAALIAVAVIATVYLLGQQLDAFFVKLRTCIETPASCVP